MEIGGGSAGQPQIQVPVVASTELALTAVNALRAEMTLRHDAAQQRMDMMEAVSKAQHEDLVRVPTEVQKANTATREFLEQVIARTAAEISHVKGRQIEGIHGEITTAIARLHGEINTKAERAEQLIDKTLQQVSATLGREIERLFGSMRALSETVEERFKGIQTQFTLLGKATEQLDLAGKTAIAAALQAQKESAAETQKSSQAAIAKSEASTSEAIKTLTVTFQQQFTAITDRINDLKSRLDRGEGGRGVREPQTDEVLSRLTTAVAALQTSSHTSEGKQAGKDYTWAIVLTILGVAIPALALLFVVVSKMQ